MEAHVWWTPLKLPGLEQLHLVENETSVVADGLVLGIEGSTPFCLWYQVWTDNDWNVRECLSPGWRRERPDRASVHRWSGALD